MVAGWSKLYRTMLPDIDNGAPGLPRIGQDDNMLGYQGHLAATQTFWAVDEA